MTAQKPDKNQQIEVNSNNQKLKNIMSWVVVIILTCFGAYGMFKLTTVHKTEGEFWKTIIKEQFPVAICLPLAGLGALFVTLILKIAAGPVEFEFAGLKFKGGAAPIVFWVICFLSIVLSIRLLWQN